MASESSTFSPFRIFSADALSSPESALILVNQPLPPALSLLLFSRCRYRICADGGANRLHELTGGSDPAFTPDCIVGDLDSATPAVLQFYRSRGVPVIEVGDQDSTDLLKSLRHIPGPACSVYILSSLSGRFDQVLACLNSLFEWEALRPKTPAYLLSDSSLCLLLPPGRHVLELSSPLLDGYCGLVPIAGPASSVTTTGLKWNVENQCMKFGGLISTSNQLDGSGVVTVSTDKHLLFTCTFTFPLPSPSPTL